MYEEPKKLESFLREKKINGDSPQNDPNVGIIRGFYLFS
jgi:hypothetical protein